MKINALVISMTLPFTVNAMRAQETRSRWHTVQGTVVDEMEEPAAMATVSWIHPSTQSRGPHCGGIWSTTDPPCGTVYNLTLSTDPQQKYLLVADGTNSLNRDDGNGRYAGQLHWIDSIAIDSRGNVYTGEVEDGKRIQKFVPANNRQTDAR